jgi:hypothetical protein
MSRVPLAPTEAPDVKHNNYPQTTLQIQPDIIYIFFLLWFAFAFLFVFSAHADRVDVHTD